MATSVARKAAPTQSPAARRSRTASASKPKPAAAGQRAKAQAAAPLNEAKAATEAPGPAIAAVPKKAKPNGAAEPKKLKLVRDSFTMPKVEYGVIGVLKTRAARLGRTAKKSDIVRAGIKALAEMDDPQFLACVSVLPVTKSGRSKA